MAPDQNTADSDSPEFSMRVTKDSLAVLLDCIVPEGDAGFVAERVQQELAALGVPGRSNLDELTQWLSQEAAQHEGVLADAVLVEGRPPIEGLDGRIEWGGSFFDTGFVVDEETGAIDYRRRVAQLSVSEGQLLAREILPEEGQPGLDVYGDPIPAKRGERADIRAGANVCADKEGGYRATIQGRVRWAAGVLSVDEVYTVEGSVGLETGDISHPGPLVVRKDIEEGAEVKAGGDIEVTGMIDAADVQSGGNITVRGGITGGEGRTIEAAGNVYSRFILDANVEAGGDVVVEREIVQSNVRCRGAVITPKGRVVGGEIRALGGIRAGQTGTEASVPTVLIAGEDYRLGKY